MRDKNTSAPRAGSYLRVLSGVRLPWILIIVSTVLSIALGRSEILVATMTGDIIDATQNAIRAKELVNYVVLTAAYAALNVASNYFTRKMEETVTMRVRVKLWKKIMRLPAAYYDADNGNELITRVTSDASAPASLISTVVTCITSVATVLQAFKALYGTNTLLANYSLMIVPIIAAVFALYGFLQFKLGVYSTKVIAGSLGYIAERVRNFRLIKSAVAEKIEAKCGSRTFKRMYLAEFLSWLGVAAFQVINSLTSIIYIFIVFVLGSRLVTTGDVTVGDLTGFYMVTGVVSVQLGLLFINAGSLFTSFGTMKKTAQVMDTPSESAEGSPVPDGMHDIVFENVVFSYNGEREVLKDLSVTVPAGKVTAVIGGNGAGKTTLFKLLTRLYEPNLGTVRFGGEDIASFDLKAWRERFAYVSQRDGLIGGTVRENLTYGLDRTVTEEELIRVTKEANCYDCIMAKPGGFDEDVGLGGANFSGGQGQCIAIARAMLRDAEILLLDEATSNLDVLSEAAVTDALGKLMRGRTTVMIAHNYAATKNADNVIVLKDGELDAVGTPDKLSCENGYYKIFARTL